MSQCSVLPCLTLSHHKIYKLVKALYTNEVSDLSLMKRVERKQKYLSISDQRQTQIIQNQVVYEVMGVWKKYYFDLHWQDLRWYTADLVSYKCIPLWTFFATPFYVPSCMFRRSLSCTSLLIYYLLSPQNTVLRIIFYCTH